MTPADSLGYQGILPRTARCVKSSALHLEHRWNSPATWSVAERESIALARLSPSAPGYIDRNRRRAADLGTRQV